MRPWQFEICHYGRAYVHASDCDCAAARYGLMTYDCHFECGGKWLMIELPGPDYMGPLEPDAIIEILSLKVDRPISQMLNNRPGSASGLFFVRES